MLWILKNFHWHTQIVSYSVPSSSLAGLLCRYLCYSLLRVSLFFQLFIEVIGHPIIVHLLIYTSIFRSYQNLVTSCLFYRLLYYWFIEIKLFLIFGWLGSSNYLEFFLFVFLLLWFRDTLWRLLYSIVVLEFVDYFISVYPNPLLLILNSHWRAVFLMFGLLGSRRWKFIIFFCWHLILRHRSLLLWDFLPFHLYESMVFFFFI